MLIILAAAGLVVTLVASWRRLRPAAHVLLPVLLARRSRPAAIPAWPRSPASPQAWRGDRQRLHPARAFLRRDLADGLGWRTRQVLDAVIARQITPEPVFTL